MGQPLKTINMSGLIKKQSNQNFKLYTSQGEIPEDIKSPKIFRTSSLQKSKFPHKRTISLATDGNSNNKAIIFSLSQKNFKTKRKDSIDEKLLKSVLIKKKKNQRPSENIKRKRKKMSHKHSKSVNNSEIENNIDFSNKKNYHLNSGMKMINKDNDKLDHQQFENNNHFRDESGNFSGFDEFNNSYLKMADTHEQNFFKNNNDENEFLMDSQINLEQFSQNNVDSLVENNSLFDVVSPINPIDKFKKKQNNSSKGNSQDYEFLFEQNTNKKINKTNIFKTNNEPNPQKNTGTNSIPATTNKPIKKSKFIFGGEFTPDHNLTTEIEDSLEKNIKSFIIFEKPPNQHNNDKAIQNISFKNFSPESKEQVHAGNLNLKQQRKSNIKDLINIVIQKSEPGEENIDSHENSIKNSISFDDNHLKEDIDEFHLETSMVDIQSTTNIDTVFDFNEPKQNMSNNNDDDDIGSLKKMVVNESVNKLSIFQKNSTANMFEHYQPSKEETNIFKNSIENNDIEILEENSDMNDISRQSSKWNLSHVNLDNESYIADEGSDNEQNPNELTEEYHNLLNNRNKTAIEETLDYSTSNFAKKDNLKSINLKKSNLAKKIARQSRKQTPIILKKDKSFTKSIYTNKSISNSNSNKTDSHDRKKISLKLKLKSSIGYSTKKSLHSKQHEYEKMNQKGSNDSYSRLDKTLGSGSLKTKGSFKSQLGGHPLNYSVTDGSTSQSKLIKNIKNKEIIKLNNKKIIKMNKNDKLSSKMSQPSLKINNNTFNKGVSLRRSHTQKKNDINKEISKNKTEEILKKNDELTPKKYSQLKLKLSKNINLMKKKSSCPNSQTSSRNKIYSVDKILNANTSSQNFENIYNKEIIEQTSKESNKSKSDQFLSDLKNKKVEDFQFNSKNSQIDSLIEESHSQIVLNIISPKLNDTLEPVNDKISSNQESVISPNTKLMKQITQNSTFLPFPRSVSIKGKDDVTYKSLKGKQGASRDETSESHLEGKNTDPITFTEGEDEGSELEGLKQNKKNRYKNAPDEYGIISDEESNKDDQIINNFNDFSDTSNQLENSNKSEPVLKSQKKEKIQNLNKSSKLKNSKKYSKELLKYNYQSSFKSQYKNYFKNFEITKKQDNSCLKAKSFMNTSNKNSTNYINLNKTQTNDSLSKLEIPKKPRISKSGKINSQKSLYTKVSKKSSVHIKNLSNFTKNIFPVSKNNFNKTISNLCEKIPQKKKIRYSLNQASKNKLNGRYKTIDKKGPKQNKLMECNLSFSKPFVVQKQCNESFNQSSILGKTFESDVISKIKPGNKKCSTKTKYNSKLKSIKQESFKPSSNFEKLIQIKKDIKKRQKNYKIADKKNLQKKNIESSKKFDSLSKNEIIINNMNLHQSQNSNNMFHDNNIPSFRNIQSSHPSQNKINKDSQNNYINIGKVNINNMVKKQETHNYIFVQPKDYSYSTQNSPIINTISNPQNIIESQELFPAYFVNEKKDSGNNCMIYNSFENIKSIAKSDKKIFIQKEILSKNKSLDKNHTKHLINEPLKIINNQKIHSNKDDKLQNHTTINEYYNQVNLDILDKSLNFKNLNRFKNSMCTSKKTSQRPSVINSNKNYEKKEFNLRNKVKNIKSQREFKIKNISKNKSSKELKKQYNQIKKNSIKKSNSKGFNSIKKSIFFNNCNPSDKSDSVYQRLSSGINQQNSIKLKQSLPWQKEDLVMHNQKQNEDLNPVQKRVNTRSSLRVVPVHNKNVKRNTSLEGALHKHSIKFMLNEQKLLDGIQPKIKNIYHLENNFQSQNFFKNKITKNSLNDTTSINSITNIERKINSNLAPLKNPCGSDNFIEGRSVDYKSLSHTKFNFESKSVLKNIQSVKEYIDNSSKNSKKNLFLYNNEKIINIKDSFLKKKLLKSSKIKNKYYCSSNIDNPNFVESRDKIKRENKIFKSTIFTSNKIKPKLSKISLSKKISYQKNDFLNKKISSIKSISKVSSNNFVDVIQSHSSKLNNIKSSTAKPTPTRNAYNIQSYSVRGSHQKPREGFFSISSHEKTNNMTEIPSSSDNITNSSMNSQQKSKMSDVNIYNQKDIQINTSGSNCEIIYKKKSKLNQNVKNLKKNADHQDNQIKLNKVIQKNSYH